MTAPLYLVSCVKTKLATPAAAADLYASDWFAKARAYVEAVAGEWRILSAEHGLVQPAQILAPYETTLLRMARPQRQAWAQRVLDQLAGEHLVGRPIVMLAGERYREFLQAPLAAAAPMAGLMLGQQKAWLAEQVRQIREAAAA